MKNKLKPLVGSAAFSSVDGKQCKILMTPPSTSRQAAMQLATVTTLEVHLFSISLITLLDLLSGS